ncbi:DUF808 family protein, partial [Enterobacter cloacae]|uniref:DUF808 family protein n=1 Tax=Enterobacter cloacae TaxID=550 RepID=UPI002B1F3FA6
MVILAGSSLLTLLDDIATLLDDISVMGKLAAKKTAGVLGDDLSLNAQQVSGVRAKEVAIKWSAAPDMTPQTVLYRRPVAQFSNFQPKI